jgi:hypothetical protein
MTDSRDDLNTPNGDLDLSETTKHLAYGEAAVMLIEWMRRPEVRSFCPRSTTDKSDTPPTRSLTRHRMLLGIRAGGDAVAVQFNTSLALGEVFSPIRLASLHEPSPPDD